MGEKPKTVGAQQVQRGEEAGLRPDWHEFGLKVSEYRKRVGMNQRTLAARSDLTPSHLNRIEKGTRRPPQVQHLLQMMQALRLSRPEAEALAVLAGYSLLILDPERTSDSEGPDESGAINFAEQRLMSAAAELSPQPREAATSLLEMLSCLEPERQLTVLSSLLVMVESLIGAAVGVSVAGEEARIAAEVAAGATGEPSSPEGGESFGQGQDASDQESSVWISKLLRNTRAYHLDDVKAVVPHITRLLHVVAGELSTERREGRLQTERRELRLAFVEPKAPDLLADDFAACRVAIGAVLNQEWNVCHVAKLPVGKVAVYDLVEQMRADFLGAAGRYTLRYLQDSGDALPRKDVLIIPGYKALEIQPPSREAARDNDGWVITEMTNREPEFEELEGYFTRLEQQSPHFGTTYPPLSEEYSEAITLAFERPGDYCESKAGLPVQTRPVDLYRQQAQPIIERGGENAVIAKKLIRHRKRQQDAMLSQLAGGETKFRFVCTKRAVTHLARAGEHKLGMLATDDWLAALGGLEPRSEWGLQHIAYTRELLDRYYPAYQVALLEEEHEQAHPDICATVWGGKGRDMFVEEWRTDPQGKLVEVFLHLTHPGVVTEFLSHFDHFWTTVVEPQGLADKQRVIEWLGDLIPATP